MKSILIFDYFATGEGWRTIIRYTNDSRVTDEMALEQLKTEYNEYFHCGFELHDVNEVKEHESVMLMLQNHVPVLYKYVTRSENDLTPFIRVNYEGYVNYS